MSTYNQELYSITSYKYVTPVSVVLPDDSVKKEVYILYSRLKGKMPDSGTTLLNKIAASTDAYLPAQSLKHKLTTNHVMKYQQLHAKGADIQRPYLVSI